MSKFYITRPSSVTQTDKLVVSEYTFQSNAAPVVHHVNTSDVANYLIFDTIEEAEQVAGLINIMFSLYVHSAQKLRTYYIHLEGKSDSFISFNLQANCYTILWADDLEDPRIFTTHKMSQAKKVMDIINAVYADDESGLGVYAGSSVYAELDDSDDSDESPHVWLKGLGRDRE